MLNEIREFEQYQEVFTDIEDIEKYRLIPSVYFRKGKGKKQKTNGLVRPMTIVARKALELREYYQTKDVVSQKEIIENVKNDLRIWCGFTEQDSSIGIQPWLRQYYALSKQNNNNHGDYESFCERDKYYSIGIFDSALENDRNTINTINYEKIIADAVFLGPLKRYYLVCKPNGMEYLEALNSDGLGYRHFQNGIRDNRNIDYLRKFVAAYLLTQQNTIYHNKYNIVNNVDLGNWTQNTTISKGESFKFTYKGTPMYQTEPYWSSDPDEVIDRETKKQNNVKCSPNPQYLSDYNFRIISEGDFVKSEVEENGEVFYSDMGSYIGDGKMHCFLCEGLEYKDMGEKYGIKC